MEDNGNCLMIYHLKKIAKLNLNYFRKYFYYKYNLDNLNYMHIHNVPSNVINQMYENYSPVFVLSHGRTGTKFLAKILNCSHDIKAFHEPKPTLQYFCNYIYKNQNKKVILTKIFDSARNELLLETFIKEKIYVETNQCLTFLAHSIADLFPKSKFIHLVRHPGDFVRSGMMKGWYNSDSIWEEGRIKPIVLQGWQKQDNIAKLTWLWNETNQYIENFKEYLGNDSRIMFLKSEDIFSDPDVIKDLFDFIGVDSVIKKKIIKIQKQPINRLERVIKQPENMKKISVYPYYRDWSIEEKQKVLEKASLSERYGYFL